MAFLNRFACLMPIHPIFSQVLSFSVSPSMTYFESVIIVSGQNGGVASAAFMIATISPTWLDWWGPGTLIDLLRWSFGAYQIPLPQCAFIFPLL